MNIDEYEIGEWSGAFEWLAPNLPVDQIADVSYAIETFSLL